MSRPSPAAYILCDPTLSYWWVGPGMRRIGTGRPCLWPTRHDAQTAAAALKEVLGLDAVPQPLRLPVRK